LNLGRIALSALITITLISGLSMAEDADALVNDSINESFNATETGRSEAGEMAPEEETAASSVQSLRGSWILNTDDGQISMVVHQSEDLLYGAANSEAPEPWNGVVTGQASEEGFELQILSLQDGVLVSTIIAGSATADDLSGTVVQSDSLGQVKEGTVNGFLVSPDTSGYEPADVPAAVAPAAAAVTPAPEAATPATNKTGETKPYTDVTALAEQMFTTFKDPSMPI
jgi:hypothetical protein